MATWWETTYSLFTVPAERYAYFVQSLEDRFYEPEMTERLGAAITLDLPVAFITEARWIRDTLAELRPDAPATSSATESTSQSSRRPTASSRACAARCASSSRATPASR